MLTTSARVTVQYDDVVWTLGPGDMLLLHPHQQATLVVEEDAVASGVWVPWTELVDIEPTVHLHTGPVPATPVGRSLIAMLSSLLTPESKATPYTPYLVERLLVEMVSGTLIEASQFSAVQRDNAPIARARRQLYLRFKDPDLTVEALSRELFISVRKLQRLFSAEGSTPAVELRNLRVREAIALLRDPDYASLNVDDIAAHSGFKDANNMRRALSSRGLPPPRAIRQRERDLSDG